MRFGSRKTINMYLKAKKPSHNTEFLSLTYISKNQTNQVLKIKVYPRFGFVCSKLQKTIF